MSVLHSNVYSLDIKNYFGMSHGKLCKCLFFFLEQAFQSRAHPSHLAAPTLHGHPSTRALDPTSLPLSCARLLHRTQGFALSRSGLARECGRAGGQGPVQHSGWRRQGRWP